MSLKKERTHFCGYTNLDFRSKGDIESLSIYQPWRIIKDFGTMGYREYDVPTKYEYKYTCLANKVRNSPDPKNYESYNFYRRNGIKINLKRKLNEDKIAELEEPIKGKDVFTGDSMMIAQTKHAQEERKYQKKLEAELKIKKLQSSDTCNRKLTMPKEIAKTEPEKIIKNNYIDNVTGGFEEFPNINREKLLGMRKNLRSRYGLKTDLIKIYKGWNRSNQKEISLNDAKLMMRDMGIPANDEEMLALIRSVNERGTDNMNVKEFHKLIYGTEQELNLDKKFKKSIEDDLNFLEEFLRLKVNKLLRKLSLNDCDPHKINFQEWNSVMKTFGLPKKYLDEKLIKKLFDKYSINGTEFLDLELFGEEALKRSLGIKCIDNFYTLKDETLKKMQNILGDKKIELQRNYSNLKDYLERNRNHTLALEKQLKTKQKIILEEKKNLLNEDKGVNISQPSYRFLNKVYENRDKYFKELNEAEKSISAYNFIRPKGKTRLGATPNNQMDSYKWMQPVPQSAMYITEKERFRKKDELYNKSNRDIRQKKIEAKSDIIKKYSCSMYNYYKQLEEKEKIEKEKSLVEKMNTLYKHELRNNLRNQLIE